MPSRGKPFRDETRHLDWDDLFHDREEPVRLANEFVAKLQRGYESAAKPILHFHGVSGQGKTSLARKLRDTYGKDQRTRRFALLELESLNEAQVREPSEVLWRIMSALAKAGVMAPLTMCLYAFYWEKQGAGHEARLDRSPLNGYIDSCEKGCEAASKVGELFGAVLDVTATAFKTVAAADKVFGMLRDRDRQRRIQELRRENPGEWAPERLESSLSEFLAVDILRHLEDEGQDVIILAVDTLDRIDPRNIGSPRAEAALVGLTERLLMVENDALRGRTGLVLFGRDPLDWARHDEEDPDTTWADLTESYRLHGFAEPDARSFLAGPYPKFWKDKARDAPDAERAERREATSRRVVEHAEAVLGAACEDPEAAPGDRRYLPYNLRLAGELIYEKDKEFRPEMLGRRSSDLQERFLRHLGDEKKRALQYLALAVQFDEEMFSYLVEQKLIAGFARQDFFPDIVASRAYVEEPEQGSGVFRFHRHMQKALLDELAADAARKAAAKPVIEALLGERSRRAAFESLAKFEPEKHLPPYEGGMEMIVTLATAGLLEIEDATRWFDELEDRFDQQTATGFRAPWLERLLPVVENALGPDHPDAATALNNLAELFWAQGRYEAAEPLYQRSLGIWEKALGLEHPHVATALNNLAALCRAQGLYEAAEPLFQRALGIREKALGPEHPDVAQSLNNLAGLYYAQGRYEAAEPLYQRSLGIREEALGPDHPHVATALNNLAMVYDAQGRYEAAEPLHQRSLGIREEALGPEHPDVAASLNNLAGLYDAQGRYEAAEPLYQRSLGIWEEALGPDHPDVATALNNLAQLYGAQGRYEAAEPLYQRSLGIWEEALGPDHPDVATALNNLAQLYGAQGRYEAAEPLCQRSLGIGEKALGPEHPHVAASLNNLAGLYYAQGRYEAAEPLLQRSLGIFGKALGANHPSVATVRANLTAVTEKRKVSGPESDRPDDGPPGES